MSGRHIRLSIALLLAAAWTWPALAGAQTCIGDCPPANATVAVNELILGVNIALGEQSLAACPSYDANNNDTVGVEELISAVNNALGGCAVVATRTATPTRTATVATPTDGPSPTITPTATRTPALGPAISFFGLTHADNSLQEPTGITPEGVPIFQRPFGFGFNLVAEADGLFAMPSTFEPGAAPSLQVQTTRALGNGSESVCDVDPPAVGGVPGIDPPQLEQPNSIADALNDFGCRFTDADGNRIGRTCGDPCVRLDDGEFHCVDEATDRQFCASVGMPMEFPNGDTLVSVRVRDTRGALGEVAQLIVRVTPP